MRDYSFSVPIAVSYGVDEAIFVHALEFWIKKNRANERHFHDGRWWSYSADVLGGFALAVRTISTLLMFEGNSEYQAQLQNINRDLSTHEAECYTRFNTPLI